MSAYGSYLMSWMKDMQKQYSDCVPANGQQYFSAILSSDQPRNFTSFQYESDKFYPERAMALQSTFENDWKLYALSMQFYNELLRTYYAKNGSGSSQKAEHVHHWVPTETPYGTKIKDANSGAELYIKRGHGGKEVIGTHKDAEGYFGRSSWAQAFMMDYDNRIYTEDHKQKSRYN